MNIDDRGRRIARQLRGAFVALHVLAICLMATPGTHGIRIRSAWQDPTVQDEFATWSQALQGLGIDVDPETLQSELWDISQSYAQWRGALVWAFKPYVSCCGTRQSWRMFSAPHRYPSRLAIDVERRGEWQRIYEARSPRLNWRSSQLDAAPMRSALFRYAWKHERRDYRSFVRWIAARAGEDYPDATRVRVQFLKARTPSPQEVRAGFVPQIEIQRRVVLRLHEQAQLR